MGWDGYLLGPTLRAPYGANKIVISSRTLCVFRSLKKCLLCSIVEVRPFVNHYFTGILSLFHRHFIGILSLILEIGYF